MSILFLTEKGLFMDGKLVEQEARMDVWPWYKILWHSIFNPMCSYVVMYKPKSNVPTGE